MKTWRHYSLVWRLLALVGVAQLLLLSGALLGLALALTHLVDRREHRPAAFDGPAVAMADKQPIPGSRGFGQGQGHARGHEGSRPQNLNSL